MTTFTIFQDATGIELWTGEAATEAEAFDLYAQDAGYANHADLIESVGRDDGVKIVEVAA